VTDALGVLVVAMSVGFAITGGAHDTANITAAAIASRALRPAGAVAIVAALGFAGPLVAGTAVADTIGSSVSLTDLSANEALGAVMAGLLSATIWNLGTWRAGIPASSTHALVGGLVGAALAAGGPEQVNWGFAALAEGQVEGVAKIFVGLLVSPAAGLLAGFIIFRAVARALRSAGRGWNRRLRRLQIGTCGLLSLAYGANEAQKTMGVIALALLLSGRTRELTVPTWAVLLSAATISAAALTGGWPIVRTLGFGIYRLRPAHAAAAQLGAAGVVGASSILGAPVSTTQVTSGAIMGVGAAERPRSVRWDTGKAIVLAWLITAPCAALGGAALLALESAVARLAG